MPIDFEAALRRNRPLDCDLCGGSEEIQCEDCAGEGTIARFLEDDEGLTCPTCEGKMYVPCSECQK